MGDAAFEFIIRPYKDTKVTFESRKFLKSFLAVDQDARVSMQQMLPDFSEVQFAVRVQVEWGFIIYCSIELCRVCFWLY